MSVGNEVGYLDFKQEDVEVRVGINPDMRFYSVGILGVPIVPTYIQGPDSKTIRMEIVLILQNDRDFSFAQHPCLGIEGQNPLCPYETSVTAVALSQDDGSMWADKQKRWHHISTFYQAKERTLKLEPTNDGTRIQRKRIYQHYGYAGNPQLGYLHLNVQYTYECSTACPKRLTLSTDNLVTLENLQVPPKRLEFEKTQQNDYRPMSMVQ